MQCVLQCRIEQRTIKHRSTRVRAAQSLVFFIMICGSLFFFQPLYCPSFIDLRLLITHLVSSNIYLFFVNISGLFRTRVNWTYRSHNCVPYVLRMTANPSRAHEFIPSFSGVRVTRSVVSFVCFADRCLYFFFLPMCCLFVFDLITLITPFGIFKLFIQRLKFTFCL